MEKLRLHLVIVVFLLAVTGAVVHSLQYTSSHDDETGLTDLQAIPMNIGKWWHGQDFPLEERIYEILETKAIIHRTFAGENGQKVFLSVVHYSDTKVDFHAPESCLGGRGLKATKTNKSLTLLLSDNKKITLEVAELITTMDTGKTLTYYFYKSGDFLGSNYIKLRLNIAINKLFRNDTRGSLIRLSTTLSPGNDSNAESILLAFLQDFFPYVQKAL